MWSLCTYKNKGFAKHARTKPSKSPKNHTDEHSQNGWRASAPQTYINVMSSKFVKTNTFDINKIPCAKLKTRPDETLRLQGFGECRLDVSHVVVYVGSTFPLCICMSGRRFPYVFVCRIDDFPCSLLRWPGVFPTDAALRGAVGDVACPLVFWQKKNGGASCKNVPGMNMGKMLFLWGSQLGPAECAGRLNKMERA